jgi:hypothetical protein
MKARERWLHRISMTFRSEYPLPSFIALDWDPILTDTASSLAD